MPTKFYLHRSTTAVGGTLPATNASVSAVAPTYTPGATNSIAVTPVLTNRSMDPLIGAVAQTSLAYSTDDVTTNQRQPFLRWVSAPIAAQTIAAQTVSVRIGGSQSNSVSSFSMVGVLAVWRPGTGAVVGRIFDVATVGITPGTTQTDVNASLGNPSTAVTAQAGDVLVLELWRSQQVQSMATSYTNSLFYDGRTEASTTDNASYLQFTNDVALVPPTTISLRSLSNGAGTFGAGWSITAPAGVAAGDFLLLALEALTTSGAPTVPTAPTGWTREIVSNPATTSSFAIYSAPYSAGLTLTFGSIGGTGTQASWVCGAYTPPAGLGIVLDGTPVATTGSGNTINTGTPTTGSAAGDYEVLAYGWGGLVSAISGVAAGSTIDAQRLVGSGNPGCYAALGHNNTVSLPASTTVSGFSQTSTAGASWAGIGILLKPISLISMPDTAFQGPVDRFD